MGPSRWLLSRTRFCKVNRVPTRGDRLPVRLLWSTWISSSVFELHRESGRLPEKLLLPNDTMRSSGSSPRYRGTGPDSSLDVRSICVKFVHSWKVSNMLPVSLFLLRVKVPNERALQSSDGIEPDSMLLSRARSCSSGKLPSSIGMLPLNMFFERSRLDTLFQLPNHVGIGPDRLLSSTVKEMTLLREANSSGIKPVRELNARSSTCSHPKRVR